MRTGGAEVRVRILFEREDWMMDTRRKVLLGVAAVLSAVIVFCVVFYVLTGSNEKL